MKIEHLTSTFGKDARDRRSQSKDATNLGALAALESFYHAFNQRSLSVFDAVWLDSADISLSNPLGGTQFGAREIRALYERIFHGPADVWVEFYDIVHYHSANTAIFVGRERGQFARDGKEIELNIRTTRVFARGQHGWKQVHHHGSIDNAAELARYQDAVSA